MSQNVKAGSNKRWFELPGERKLESGAAELTKSYHIKVPRLWSTCQSHPNVGCTTAEFCLPQICLLSFTEKAFLGWGDHSAILDILALIFQYRAVPGQGQDWSRV